MSLAASAAPLELESCPCELCGGTATEPWLAAADRNWPIHAGTFEPLRAAPPSWQLVRCVHCDLIWLNPRPTPASLSRFYPASYYAYESAAAPAAGVKTMLKRWLRRRRVLWQLLGCTPWAASARDPIIELLGWRPAGTVLDVGCGAGEFLNALAALGWKTMGIDVHPAAVAVARARGHDVRVGDLTEVALPAASVDVVWMSHVLEHTPRPRQVLAAVRRLLRPDGQAVITVPNIGSLWARLLGEANWALDLPRHLYHFTPGTIRRLLEESGFVLSSLRTINTSRYFVHCLALAGLQTERLDPRALLENRPLHDALEPVCRALEAMGDGVQLQAIVRRAG